MVRSKHCTPERWVCYTVSVAITLALIAVVVVVTRSVDTINEGENLAASRNVWHYECQADKCIKLPITAETKSPIGLVRCRQTCGIGARSQGVDVWPMLTGRIEASRTAAVTYVPIRLSALRFEEPAAIIQPDVPFFQLNHQRLVEQIRNKRAAKTSATEVDVNAGATVSVRFDVRDDDVKLHMAGNETYRLRVDAPQGDLIAVRIEADTIFGARHGIETLSQLIIYDDFNDEYLLRTEVVVEDGPVYTHRGVSLDTSRNYFSVGAIKRTIDAMAMVKLNVFHWHITDSHSFPVVIKSHPYLHRYGAYSPDKIYTAADVADIVRYAYVRGIHVLPEFDAPAHVGEGWQSTNLTTCFNIQPWTEYCYEAPCGQLDPTQDRVYDILEDIYAEMLEMFGHPEWFHMGGDEVKTQCWATSETLKDWMTVRGWPLELAGYMRLWDYFQRNALERLDKVAFQQKAEKIIMWTSTLTEDPWVGQYLDPERYIVQVWTESGDANIKNLLSKGFELIMSNTDALYLDCGFEAWVGLGNNWCSPYSGWHKIYNQDLKVMGGDRHKQIIGAEAALWSEQADDQSLDGRIWPRAMALAERLWSDPATNYREAESRILLQRERLVENGIRSEMLQPEWCVQNEGNCHV